ncbi:ABC transporter ATP-binding protein [Paenibacillus larvae]|uniref:Bacitracin ABC transporter ATP-binding protein n=6 Tax=Paenibacillus larvae TaxID=1464 RepID=A0A1V0UZ42_9BACL|nr:ABC transporter ATP-binding protein [Paenibacillus larvae]AQR76796.1 bacitracin ABC transporter ATP-binding protein [Paenibacillus larvae subsp. larvae]ARF70457.1 bacitracin ABC transporter ATP-binding protein [Paenibacillus larvae subsp. pulvifaciens]AVF22318.1 ABC transporter, ATP-binding protein [Paenibacillus larvae subsp. larvae]MDE5152286.1 ABC transporter ATP-binding protein [Paenibacillus larvae subsp. larvae]MDR5584251.1 ABC transporter ATP-binding protein [Paenibacillus larvae]
MAKPVLITKGVSKVFGIKNNLYTALDRIDLEVNEGEFVGIMGPSGAGKTTLMNMISTIDTPTSGDIIIDGQSIVKMKEEQLALFRRNKLGFVFQDYNLLDSLTVRENIALPLALSHVKAAGIDERVVRIAKKFGIDPILDKYPYQISGGQKQRCAASRALVSNPSLILGDEPTGALDSKSATDLLESMKEMNEKDRVTILMVTHDAFAASYCQRVLFIKDGRLFTELHRQDLTRKQFFNAILNMLSSIGGGVSDVI